MKIEIWQKVDWFWSSAPGINAHLCKWYLNKGTIQDETSRKSRIRESPSFFRVVPKIFMSFGKTAARKREGIIGARVAIRASPATEWRVKRLWKKARRAARNSDERERGATVSLRGMLMNLALNESIPRPRRDLEIQRWWIPSRARGQDSSGGPWRELWPTRVAGSFPEGKFLRKRTTGNAPTLVVENSTWTRVLKKRLRARAPTTDLRFTFCDVIYSLPSFLADLNCVRQRVEGKKRATL